MSWLILQAHDSVAAIAILMFCFWLPIVFLGPLFGVVADRYSRKGLIIAGNALRGIVLMGFGWYLQYQLSVNVIYLLMLSLGTCFSLYLPAMIALVREIVSPDELLYANSTIDIAFEVGNVVGMGTAGFFIALLSSPMSILLIGAVFVISTFAMIGVRVEKRSIAPTASGKSFINDFILGLRYLSKNRKLKVIYSVQLLLLVGFMTTPVLLAPFAKNVLGATVSQFGQIEAALSIGIIVGGLFMPWVADRYGLYPCLITLCLLLAVLFSWFAINRYVAGAELLYLGIGVGLSVWPLMITRAQQLTDLDFQGRIQSVFNSLSGVLILGAYLLVVLGSHLIPISALYVFEVALALVASFLLWRYRGLLSGN